MKDTEGLKKMPPEAVTRKLLAKEVNVKLLEVPVLTVAVAMCFTRSIG